MNNTTKRLIALLLAVPMLFSVSCGKTEKGTEGGTENETETETEYIEEEPKMHDGKTAVMISDPDKKLAYGDAMAEALSKTVAVKRLNYDETDADTFNTEKTDVIILEDASRVAGNILDSIGKFRDNGGKVITLGGPMCDMITSKCQDGKYLTFDEQIASASGSTSLLNTEDAKMSKKIGRNTGDPSAKKTVTFEDCGLGHNSLKCQGERFSGWDLMTLSVKVPADTTTLSFSAKAEGSSTLYMELYMKNGQRWLATYKTLSPEWEHYTFTQKDFSLWYSTSGKFSWENVAQIWIGVSDVSSPDGYTLCIDSVRILNFEESKAPDVSELTAITEYYKITNAAKLKAYSGQAFIGNRKYTVPAETYSTIRSMEGTGVGKNRSFRFVPLIEVNDEKGLQCGYSAWMNIYKNGGMLAAFPMSAEFFNEQGINAVRDVVIRMLDGAYMLEGGTESYVYVSADTDKIEAKATLVSPVNSTLHIGFMKDGEEIKGTDIAINAGNEKTDGSFEVSTAECKPDHVEVSIVIDGKVRDKIAHPILCYEPVPENERKYVTLEGNAFMRDGKPLQLIGVNYFGRYGGIVGSCAFAANSVFDPYLVRCDLERIKEIGFNAIAVQISPSADGPEAEKGMNLNMIQVFSMARELGLYVDVYVPFVDTQSTFDSIVKNLHIADFDNVIAYDIVWEGASGSYAGMNTTSRQTLNKAWSEWAKEQYGSLDAAGEAFGRKFPKTVDFDKYLIKSEEEPEILKAVNAFRRFRDDYYGKYFGGLTERIKATDPHHFVSFRCCDAGIPSANSYQGSYTGLYDFSNFCGALDFVSPEGYGFTSYQFDASSYEGAFAEAYARMVCGDTATVWKEFGWSCYGGSYTNMASYEEYNAYVYGKVYDALLYGQGNGSFCWWYAGGLRVDEGSDYGVVNPDGSDRAATKVVREYAEKLAAIKPAETHKADVVFTVDKDEFPNGFAGVYASIKDEFNAAIDEGKTVALVSRGDTMNLEEAIKFALDGSDSVSGPRKYVNGLIKSAADENGKVLSGSGMKLKKESTATVAVANTGYTDWKDGEVKLCLEDGTVLAEIPATAQGKTAYVKITVPKTKFTMRLSAYGIMFGAGTDAKVN